MSTIRVRPDPERRVLTSDLKDILAALGPWAQGSYWTVAGVPAQGEGLDATGEGAAALEQVALSGERIIGSDLAKIADRVDQVIWGEFKGYDDKVSDTPRVAVLAFDSSWWEIQSEDVTLIDKVAKRLGHTQRV